MRGLLGADLFVTPLLVFIITTGLLFMNTNKNVRNASEDHHHSTLTRKQKPAESELPRIELPRGNSEGVSIRKKETSVNLSARIEGQKILYFLDDKPVSFEHIRTRLMEKHASSVRIRFDRALSYGLYVGAIEACKDAGVKEIINVYTKESGGR